MGIDGRVLESVDTSNSVIAFTGKKKSSKKKDNCNIFSALSEEAGVGSEVMDVVEPKKSSTGTGKIEALDSEVMKSKEVPETSKSRKKKKTGRTAQEEDDLDKILSELVASVDGPAEKDGEEEVPPTDENHEETEIERTEPKTNQVKGKAAEKKVPKHVREMQEALARLEELERQREDARRRKREREREKLLKKRLEGKPITAKEKEEARRLEAMRNQILANAAESLPLPTTDHEKPANRPLIQKKNSKPAAIAPNGVAPAKASWDHCAVNLSLKHGFSDEEIDSKPEPVVKKHIKSAGAKPTVSAQTNVPTQSIKSQNVENKKKSRKEDVEKETATSDAAPKESEDNLRSPICCIMGHVDTGKTKLLDCIRGTNVKGGEAGGITQQIGATYFPAENIRERTKELKADVKLKVPGLLVIDTPGHESFTNLQSRGSGLCDIAVLAVDIMHGLEPQTIESLNLLKMRNTKFIVALNKVDRLYGWKTCRNAPIEEAMKQQSRDVKIQFETQLYSGEGIPDLLLVLAKLTEKTMVENLTYRNEVQADLVHQCTVLEVKVIEGLGTTFDVVLVNGVLHEGDQIVVCGIQASI
ncbi:eukaryotic translation initiation factor 5B [Prunus yedoensis var. nudiflora]|uniref:Eukaryotic translation initiation factor 5B n=1 Tax=Prunus yedoensis var. nudiflora TaxID=2094558 RepID=A0A314YI29_PRUYE|nr:eukaryotic translation initiation factor 5B [Prunus yedoensis var. nudiflora]